MSKKLTYANVTLSVMVLAPLFQKLILLLDQGITSPALKRQLMQKEYSIQGKKVSLFSLREEDALPILRLRNDPAYNKHLSNAGKAIELHDQLAWMRKVSDDPHCIDLKIVDNDTGAFYGTAALYDLTPSAGEFGRYLATNAIAAIEAEYLILRLGFETLNLEYIYCNTVADNAKVWKQHLKFGLVHKGEDFDERIGKTRITMGIERDAFERFDYGSILGILDRF